VACALLANTADDIGGDFGSFCYPVTSTWLHLRCDVGLEEGEYKKYCLCVTVLCTFIMVHKGTSSSYRSVDSIGL